jgi:uncharacterized membrane protein (DUF485 family)
MTGSNIYSIIRFGSLYGLVLVIGFYAPLLALGTTPDNFTMGEIVGYTVMFISSLAIITGIKDYKQTLIIYAGDLCHTQC